MNARRSLLKCGSGAAAAEMALVLPFLLILLFGSVELGYYFYNEHQVIKGVRDGARFAARQSFEVFNCNSGPVADENIPAGVKNPIKEVTRTGQPSGGTARVVGWSNSDIKVSITCPATPVTTGIYRNEVNAPQINIVTTVSYRSLFAGLGVANNTYRLNASQQAAVVGI